MGLVSLVVTRVIEPMMAATETKRPKDFHREVFLLGVLSRKGRWDVAMIFAKSARMRFSSHGVLK